MESNIELTLYYQNTRGLNTKVKTFFCNLLSCDYSIISLTETWLKDTVFSTELFGSNYSVYRMDRTSGRGGGVLIAVSNKYHSESLPLTSPILSVDLVGVKVTCHNKILNIINLYIPPTLSLLDYSLLFDYLESSLPSEDSVIITGDFNIPELQTYYITNRVTRLVRPLVDFLQFSDYVQHNHVLNSNDRLLDLILSTSTLECSVNHSIDTLVDEDVHHPALLCEINLHAIVEKNFELGNAPRYNFKMANFPALYTALQELNWEDLLALDNVNSACDYFYESIYNVFDGLVPKQSIPHKRQYPKWFNKEIIQNIKLKTHYHRQYKKKKLPYYKQRFSDLRSTIKSDIKVAYNNFIRSAENSITNDPTRLWNYVNAKKMTTRIPGCMIYNDSEYKLPQDIVDSFACHFSSVFTKSCPDEAIDNGVFPVFNENVLSINEISESDILKAVTTMKPKLTAGPDSIPAFIVKDCISCFLVPLCYIFNLSLKTTTFPNKWKISKIVPVYKSGNKCHVENYRPIGVISNFAKLLESVVTYYLYNHVFRCIAPEQHGFMKGRSVNSNLCNFTQSVSDALNARDQVDVIYTDISKAFDQIDHNILIHKFDCYSFNQNLVLFFKSYLSDRLQFVEFMGHKSILYEATSGVTQGSNLGPLLFLLYINDIVLNVQCSKLLYADDLKIFKVIRSEEDCISLQSDLNNIYSWCNNNKLNLNIKKCNVLTFTRKCNSIDFNYHINNVTLTRVNTIKDLGVTFDQKLSFTFHFETVSKKAMQMLGFVIRNTREFKNKIAIKTLYYAYVRSKLEYACVVWFPCYNVHVQTLESVQRKFCKYLFFNQFGYYPNRDLAYNELLQVLDIDSLQKRWVTHQIVYLHKVVNNIIDDCDFLSRVMFHVPRFSIRHNLTFDYNTPNSNQHMFSPLISMCRSYNHTQHNIDIFSCSQYTLKNTLKDVL